MTVLTTNEQLVEAFMERAVDLLRLESGARARVAALLADLESEIVAAIAKIDPTEPGRPAYQRLRLAKLQELVSASIRASYREADVTLAREIRELVDIESKWTATAFNSAIGFEFVDAGLTREALKTLVSNVLIDGAPTAEWWKRQAAGLANKFADEMRKGVTLGETNADLIARVRGTATQRGIMDMSHNAAERLVRSSVQTAANVGREAMYADNADIISALKWSATLDTRTSTWCFTRDGHLYSVDEDHKPKDGGPPWLQGPGKIHWNCRSTSVPVLKTWRELGIDEDDVPQTTRASMDGQVPESLSFEDWLRKQGPARQDTVLGKGKADLWRRGKIEFADLLDQSGRPLTTEELRAKASKKDRP